MPSLAIRISVAAVIPTLIIPFTAHGVELDRAERQRVIDGVISNLKERYVDQAMARKVAEALVEYERAGDYQVIRDGAAFAALLTRQLRDVSRDMHLEVVYTRSVLPENPRGPAMERQNCTFESVQTLPHNIGYLKLNSFPDLAVCEPTAKAAMASLNLASAQPRSWPKASWQGRSHGATCGWRSGRGSASGNPSVAEPLLIVPWSMRMITCCFRCRD